MDPITIALCGDVMTGRGVDQVLPHPGDPALREAWVRDAREYVELAERKNGPITRPVPLTGIWGDALAELELAAPRARVINLETSVTTSADFWAGKEIHYRMHPANAGLLAAARIDVCTLANNHVLDFGVAGLLETLRVVRATGVTTAGAGADFEEALAPARIPVGDGALLVFSLGSVTSGVPPAWAARADRPGVAWLPVPDERAAAAVAERIARERAPGDRVIVSVHMGSNWGWSVPAEQVRFAHALIEAGADIVHGHSSHHVRPIELHRGKLVLHGCGDFLNDYEGISGYERYRGDLALLWVARIDPGDGRLIELVATPMQIRQLRPRYASDVDRLWLFDTLARISGAAGARLHLGGDGRIRLRELS